MFHASIGGGGGGGWFLFQIGGTSFLSGTPGGGGLGFGGGGGFEKNRKTGWASPMPPHAPPLWEILGYWQIIPDPSIFSEEFHHYMDLTLIQFNLEFKYAFRISFVATNNQFAFIIFLI